MDKISVVICTHNRGPKLELTLQSLAAQATGFEGTLQLLIVDNNSHDGTRELVEKSRSSLGRLWHLDYVFEAQIGLSHARNTAIQAADGEIVVFLDDDVMVHQGWLDGMISVFVRFDDAGAVGGKVNLVAEQGIPDWFPKEFLVFYCCHRSDGIIRATELRHFPMGANVAYHREVFQELGGFRPDLGRSGQCLLSCEESDFHYRIWTSSIVRNGLYYTPHAQVDHLIPPDRLEKDAVESRLYWQGRSEMVIEQIRHGDEYCFRRLKTMMAEQIPNVWHKLDENRSSRNSSAVFFLECQLARMRGYGDEFHSRMQKASRKRETCPGEKEHHPNPRKEDQWISTDL
jgi:glycosyltransferase involved in cell wall biosynthesis